MVHGRVLLRLLLASRSTSSVLYSTTEYSVSYSGVHASVHALDESVYYSVYNYFAAEATSRTYCVVDTKAGSSNDTLSEKYPPSVNSTDERNALQSKLHHREFNRERLRFTAICQTRQQLLQRCRNLSRQH